MADLLALLLFLVDGKLYEHEPMTCVVVVVCLFCFVFLLGRGGSKVARVLRL